MPPFNDVDSAIIPIWGKATLHGDFRAGPLCAYLDTTKPQCYCPIVIRGKL